MSTPTSTRIPITTEDIELALIALTKYASEDGLTPVRGEVGMRLTPHGVLRHELGLSQKRSETVMLRLVKLGLVARTEHSTKVVIASMAPANDAPLQDGAVTNARIRAAIIKLRHREQALREEIADLEQRIAELESHAAALEAGGDLDILLSEVEAA